MFRRFLFAIVLFLIIVVVVADRVGAVTAGHVLAGKLQTDEHLQNRPSVSIKGIPFLTQAFGGNYSDVKVTDHEVLVEEVPITTLAVDLRGLHLPLSNAIRGSVSTVPVDHVTGTAFVSFSDANSYLAHHLPTGTSIRLSPGSTGSSVSISDRVRLSTGQRIVLRGTGGVAVSRNVVTVDVGTLTPAASGVARGLVARALAKSAISFPLQTLPFQLALKSITVTSVGLSAEGSSDKVVLGTH